MRVGSIAAATALVLALPTAAAAQPFQSTAQIVATVGGSALFSESTTPVRIAGALTISFYGDPASGCAAAGLCGYSGTITWLPPTTAELDHYRYRDGSKIEDGVTLSVGFPRLGSTGPATSARVSSIDGTSCADATQGGEFLSFGASRLAVTVSLRSASPALLTTRCAGPVDADVIPALPSVVLPFASLARGEQTADLSATRRFASHGFAGTVRSTLALSFGRPRPQSVSGAGIPKSVPTRTFRQIQVRYRASLAGTVTEHAVGDSNPLLCSPLGSCGSTSTLTLRPRVAAADAYLTAIAPASRALRDLLTAVGLVRGGRTKGVVVFGGIDWPSGGRFEATVTRGAERCSDSGPAGGGSLSIVSAGATLSLQYNKAAGYGFGGVPMRCPGPRVIDSAEASAQIRPTALLTTRAQLMIATGASFTDDGWSGTTAAALRLTLRRLGVKSTLVRLPADAGSFSG